MLQKAAKVVNPPMLKWFDQLEKDIQESIYNTNRTMPIGRSPDQRDNLPPTFDPMQYTCGRPSDKSNRQAQFSHICFES